MDQSKQDAVKKLAERAKAAAADVIASRDWQAYTAAMAKFHRYSVNNVWLIYAQKPDATMVNSYKRWQQLGRQVRKGETGLRIFAPHIHKNDDGEVDRIGFHTVAVFDISQTDGDPLPELEWEMLDGDDERAEWLWPRLVAHATAIGVGVALSPEALLGQPRGVWKPREKKIEVRAEMPPAQRVKTLAHELAHATFGHGDGSASSRSEGEVEAEMAAAIVCEFFGLQTGGGTAYYLAEWADGDVEAIGKRMESARKAAATLIDAVEGAEAPELEMVAA